MFLAMNGVMLLSIIDFCPLFCWPFLSALSLKFKLVSTADHRIGITKCLPKPFSLGRLIFPKFRKPKFRAPIFSGLLKFGNPT